MPLHLASLIGPVLRPLDAQVGSILKCPWPGWFKRAGPANDPVKMGIIGKVWQGQPQIKRSEAAIKGPAAANRRRINPAFSTAYRTSGQNTYTVLRFDYLMSLKHAHFHKPFLRFHG